MAQGKGQCHGTPLSELATSIRNSGQDAVRVWTAPKSGRVRSPVRFATRAMARGQFRLRLSAGSGSYAPWYALYGRTPGRGFHWWDYFGHWDSSFAVTPQGTVTAQLKVAGYQRTSPLRESITTPKAFVGLFSDDLDMRAMNV